VQCQRLGGALEINDLSKPKYVFAGSNVSDFGDPTKWAVLPADTAGAPPATLGTVDSTLYSLVTSHSLNLPCCGGSGSGPGCRKANASNNQGGTTNNNTSENIMVYPNPTTGDLNFEFPTGSGSITLMEITGQVLEKQALNNTSSAVFSLSSYAPGLYMYQVTVNGVTKTGKVVLTH